jgi:hypothetical protein
MHLITARIPTRTFFVIALAGLWDIVAGQPLLAFAAVIGLVGSIPAALISAARSRQLLTRDSVRVLVLVLSLACSVGLFQLNRVVAAERAETLVVGVERFHHERGVWPEHLYEVLAAGYIDELPPPMPLRAWFNSWGYDLADAHGERHPHLRYVVAPPFGRRYYCFESQRWGALD